MSEEIKFLEQCIKQGLFKAMLVIIPDYEVKLKDQLFIDTMRYGIKVVGGRNTRFLTENESALAYAHKLAGKKKPYVHFKIVNEGVLDDFINAFKKEQMINLIPSELSLKELDEQFKNEGLIKGLDSEFINDFMRLWHYQPTNNKPIKQRINYHQLLLKRLEYIEPIGAYDPMLANKIHQAEERLHKKY